MNNLQDDVLERVRQELENKGDDDMVALLVRSFKAASAMTALWSRLISTETREAVSVSGADLRSKNDLLRELWLIQSELGDTKIELANSQVKNDCLIKKYTSTVFVEDVSDENSRLKYENDLLQTRIYELEAALVEKDEQLILKLQQARLPVVKFSKDTGNRRLDVPDKIVKEAFLNGATVQELAAAFSMSENGIKLKLRREGVWQKRGPGGIILPAS